MSSNLDQKTPLLTNAITRLEKLKDPRSCNFSELFALFSLLYTIFVILKHLIFHTFLYNWHRHGRKRLTAAINSFKNSSTTIRILSSGTNGFKKSTPSEICHCIFKFSQASWYEFFPSLLDARKEQAFISEMNFENNHHILMILPDNCCQELFLLLKNIQDKKLDQLASATYTIIDVIINSGNLKVNAEIVKAVEGLEAMRNHHKITINFIGSFEEIKFKTKYDSIYFNDGPKNYNDHLKVLLQNQSFTKNHTKLLANNVMLGGEGATDFLMYVRRDDKFETKFFIGNLEATPKDKILLDGIERVRLV